MGIVDISQKKPYKIAKWCLLALGCLFLLFGGLFALVGMARTSIMPNEIHLTTNGIFFNEVEGRYSLDVSRVETSVMVNTLPLRSGSPVTFSLLGGGENAIKITDRPTAESNSKDLTLKNRNGKHVNAIYPGDSFFITLIGGATTPFRFGDTVEITIESGTKFVVFNVNILPPDRAEFKFAIRDFGNLDPFPAIPADQYFNEVWRAYEDGAPNPASHSRFEFDVSLAIWGSSVRDFANPPTFIPLGVKNDDGKTIIEGDSDIHLRGIPEGTEWFTNGFTNIYIPQGVIAHARFIEPVNCLFMVTVDYVGVKHIDFFTLRIVKSLS